ncbi:MAG: multicopper oxidase family protein [Streptosporangiaceae bacterium]|jgi:FtsP/CotA-like multicopper oxidase with cupredoxin domain
MMRYGLGTAGATLAGGVPGARARGAGAPSPVIMPASRRPRELPQPRLLRSADGVLDVRLTAAPAVVDMGAPRLVRTYTWNKVVPGYTWEIRPGDLLRVRLRNRLPYLPPPKVMVMDRPHEWTHTNLHTHGLHVSPSGNADNVFLDIPPGGEHRYEIPVPHDHPGGLSWYHPHRHGGVTQQLRAGMAGMLIVRGEIDRVPEVRAAAEKVMVLQSIQLGDDYQLLDPIPDPAPDQAFFPRAHALYTVNGVLRPRLRMYPGEVQRWRLLNAADSTFLSLHLNQHDFHVLAWDGLTLAEPDTTGVVMLSPGNRVDLLVRAGRAGSYDLVLTPGSSQQPDIPGMPGSAAALPGPRGMAMPGFPPFDEELARRTVLTVHVTGHGRPMGLPDSLPAWNPPVLPISRRRNFAFTVQREPDHAFLSFGVDGVPYDPAAPPYRIPLGTAEEWTLVNAFDPKLMNHAHVFHIHVNPFRITRINGRVLDKPLWRDTFVLPKLAGDSLTFESNFTDFPGKFVEHCHMTSHEDLGMMSAIEVVARSGGPA